VTNRERIMAMREGYAASLMEHRYFGYDDAFDTAAKKYPMPKKKVPSIANTTQGQYMIEGGRVFHRMSDRSAWKLTGFLPSDLTALGQIVRFPTIEVEDE